MSRDDTTGLSGGEPMVRNCDNSGDAIVAHERRRGLLSCSIRENWHALDNAIRPWRTSAIRYVESTIWPSTKRRSAADIVFPDSDFSSYAVGVAPMLYMLRDGLPKSQGVCPRGGTFVTKPISAALSMKRTGFESGYPALEPDSGDLG